MNTRPVLLLALVVTAISFALPTCLAWRVLPMGEGPDEPSHHDRIYFKFARPKQPILQSKGLLEPGFSPLGQSHQGPLYYWAGAEFLNLFHSPSEVGGFPDYQAGISPSSAGALLGGPSACSYREDPTRDNDTATERFRIAFKSLRTTSALFLAISALLAFASARLAVPTLPWIALAATLLHSGFPTSLFRSIFITNDNLVAVLGSLVFFLSLRYLTGRSAPNLKLPAALGITTGLCTLAKYNGVWGMGVAFLAILLRRQVTLRQRALSLLVSVLGFAVIVLPVLWINASIDGDPFSVATMAHDSTMLERPSSFWAILFDRYFVQVLLTRFFLELHTIVEPALQATELISYSWWLLGGISVLGFLFSAFPFRKTSALLDSRVLIHILLSFIGAVFLVILYGIRFPVPGGRYLHQALVPGALIVSVGLASALRLLACGERITCALSAGVFAFGVGFVLWFSTHFFSDCRRDTQFNVDGGVTVASGDLDRDGSDEIFFFHRARNRLFVARETTRGFNIKEDWTRSVGLVADWLLSADANGDGRTDVLYFRRSQNLWAIVDGRSILNWDKKRAQYRDQSANYVITSSPEVYGATPLLGDINRDGEADLVSFENGRFRVMFGGITLGQVPFFQVLLGKENSVPFLVRTSDETLFAAYDPESGKLALAGYRAEKRAKTLRLPKTQRLLAIDLSGDRSDEILHWGDHDRCPKMVSLKEPMNADANQAEICLPFPLTRHQELFGLKGPAGEPDRLAILDKRTGVVTIRGKNSDSTSTLMQFDAGWMGAEYRLAPFQEDDKSIALPDRASIR